VVRLLRGRWTDEPAAVASRRTRRILSRLNAKELTVETAVAVKNDHSASVFGAVDAFDPQFGLTGWCADISDGGRQLEVELVVNGVPVATTCTAYLRADVCAKIGVDGRFGYCFDAAVFDAFLPNKKIFADKDYSVRECGKSSFLGGQDDLPDLGALLDARDAFLKRGNGRALVDSLEQARERAHDLLFQPLRKLAADSDGVIEAIAHGDGGVIWFVGWISHMDAPEFPAVVLDRRKFPAGIRCAYYLRADLAEPAIGIVGAILSEWRPTAGSEALILFGDGAQRQLRAVRPLRVTTIRDVLSHLIAQSDADSRAVARQLFALARETDGWTLETPAAKKIKLAVDQANYLDGFGVFLKGWALSPTHRITSMTLKLGDAILEGAQSSLHFAPRPDLASAFPGAGSAIDRAGFTCVFRGELRAADFDEAILRLSYENNQSTHHRLDDLSIGGISAAGDLSELCSYYRFPEREHFFPGLARAYYDFCGTELRRAIGEIVNPCASALIFCAPVERHLQYRLFGQLREHLEGCSARGVGVAIVAQESQRHGEIGELFAELSARFAGPASLVFVSDVNCGLWSLSSVMSLVGSRRFVFVGPDVSLDSGGWAALGDLIGAGEDLAFLEVSDPVEPWRPVKVGTSAFSWTTRSWTRWIRDHRLPLRASIAADAFAVESRRIASGGECARRSETPRLIEEVNRACRVGSNEDEGSG